MIKSLGEYDIPYPATVEIVLDQLENLVDAKQLHPDFIFKVIGSNKTMSSIIHEMKGDHSKYLEETNGLVTLAFVVVIIFIVIMIFGLAAICFKLKRRLILCKLKEIAN